MINKNKDLKQVYNYEKFDKNLKDLLKPNHTNKNYTNILKDGYELYEVQLGKDNLEIDGLNILHLSDREIAKVRNKKIGFVFQFHRLLPEFSAMENIMIPQMLTGLDRNEAAARADQLLGMVGLQARADFRPGLLSGGEQQRVAIARALALDPEVMLFDEPTSALDPERVKEVLDAMRQLAKGGMTMVVVTHELGFAREVADRVMFMDRGQVVETSDPETFFSNAREERSRRFLNQMQH